MAQVLINGKAFSATDITVIIGGLPVASVSSLTATVTQDKTNNPGFSEEPVSRGRATKTYECSIDLAYKDVQVLRNLSPTRSLLEIPVFEVLVIMNNNVNLARIRVNNAEFTDDGIEVAEGDTEVKRTYNLIVAGIDFL